MQPPDAGKPPLVDQIADRHTELESLIKVAAKAKREATQPERKHEWYLCWGYS